MGIPWAASSSTTTIGLGHAGSAAAVLLGQVHAQQPGVAQFVPQFVDVPAGPGALEVVLAAELPGDLRRALTNKAMLIRIYDQSGHWAYPFVTVESNID